MLMKFIQCLLKQDFWKEYQIQHVLMKKRVYFKLSLLILKEIKQKVMNNYRMITKNSDTLFKF